MATVDMQVSFHGRSRSRTRLTNLQVSAEALYDGEQGIGEDGRRRVSTNLYSSFRVQLSPWSINIQTNTTDSVTIRLGRLFCFVRRGQMATIFLVVIGSD